MKIYLAGAYTSNLTAFWRDNAEVLWETVMKIYFAGTRSRGWLVDCLFSGALAMELYQGGYP